MTQATILTGQDIGMAARATRALLDMVLDEAGTTFEIWVTLNTLAQTGSPVRRDALRWDLAGRLGVDESSITPLLDQLASAGLVEASRVPGGTVDITPDGEAMYGRLRDAIARTSADLYAGLDPDDLAVTRRVLLEVTDRATARLDG